MPCTHPKCMKENAKEIRPKVYWWRCLDCGLEVERDERPIDETLIAAEAARVVLLGLGAKIAQDVIDLGCTGMVAAAFAAAKFKDMVGNAQLVRGNMAGAGFGLPCYVPPTRFCLVHNVIGALEPGQEGKHPEGIELCSRKLNAEEEKMAAAMDILTQGKSQDEPAPAATATPTMAPSGSPIVLYDGFVCPEHREPIWRCRYCLAAAVIAGDFEPMTMVRTVNPNCNGVFHLGDQLELMLDDSTHAAVELYVRAAVWQRKMVLDRG